MMIYGLTMPNDSVEFNIEGVDNLLIKFKSIGFETKYKSGRFALRKAAQVIRDAARNNALSLDDPATGRQIAKNIVERWDGLEFRHSGNLAFRVGVLGGAARSNSRDAIRARKTRRQKGVKSLEELGELVGKGKNNPGGDTWYWRLHEFGSEKTAAKPFMKPAMSDNVQKALDTFAKEYEKSIDRAIKKAKKTGRKA